MLALLSSEPAIDLQQLESLGADSFLLASYSPIYLMACGSGFMGVESPRTAALSPSTIPRWWGFEVPDPHRLIPRGRCRCSLLVAAGSSRVFPMVPPPPPPAFLALRGLAAPTNDQESSHFTRGPAACNTLWALKGSLRQQLSANDYTIG